MCDMQEPFTRFRKLKNRIDGLGSIDNSWESRIRWHYACWYWWGNNVTKHYSTLTSWNVPGAKETYSRDPVKQNCLSLKTRFSLCSQGPRNYQRCSPASAVFPRISSNKKGTNQWKKTWSNDIPEFHSTLIMVWGNSANIQFWKHHLSWKIS